MKQRRVRNRLFELVQERDRQLGRRMRLRDIAEFIGVSDHTITSWMRNEVTRFDNNVIVGLCDFFEIEISDLLYFEWVEEDEEPKGDDSNNEDES